MSARQGFEPDSSMSRYWCVVLLCRASSLIKHIGVFSENEKSGFSLGSGGVSASGRETAVCPSGPGSNPRTDLAFLGSELLSNSSHRALGFF